MSMRRSLLITLSFWLALGQPCAVPASAAEHASSARTSRWWKLTCGEAGARDAKPPACVLTVRLRGGLDSSRLHLTRETLLRRDAAQRALRREVAIHVDVDSQGGQIFSAMEIGRILRNDGASISVARGASCLSACVFLLMGAPSRSVSSGARIGIHRPSLGGAESDALVAAMAAPIELYAEQTNVSRAIVADMMAIPSDRVRLLSAAELDTYGIHVSRAP